MLTLAFDTTSKTAAVALLKDKEIIYDTIINTGLNHSEVILPAIDQALGQERIKITDIDLLACTIGPGSFTGVRIGVSTIKGLMLATGKPAVGISSLAALALNAGSTGKLICSILDAGRGQIYTAYFRYNKKGILEQLGTEKVIKPQNLLSDIKEDVVCIGEGAVKYQNVFRNIQNKNLIIDSALPQYIKGSAVGILGIDKFARNELLKVEECVPVYLRSADARPKKALFEKLQFP